ncbi:hypothetical protein BBJ28_00019451 [Nothophytophthora sp. Chile5]|nr:hypothetical protein BBJ28_00019451 [Nothophytophthora sp. Chile5]
MCSGEGQFVCPYESRATKEHVPLTCMSKLQKLRESYVALKLKTDKKIAFLKQQLAAAQAVGSPVSSKTHSASSIDPIAPHCVAPLLRRGAAHALVPTVYSITNTGIKPSGRIDRLGSLKSAQVLAALRPPPALATGGIDVARRVVAALADSMVATLPYLRSLQFAADLVELSAQVGALLEREARCLSLASPVYVFGDVHGNWTDLQFFAEHMWRLGLELTAGRFLFLGDYVDRGSASLECTAYLFAHKLLHPDKLFLLRGNHETRAVNGLEAVYGTGCLLAQCKARFGADEGVVVWHQLNHAFDRLPVAAVINDDVFCVHGGIPRPVEGSESSLEAVAKLPAAVPLDSLDPSYFDGEPQLSMIADMIWGDPVRNEEDSGGADGWRLDPRGFGKSPRGGVAVCFGSRAVDKFLGQHGFSRILRAHEAAREGLSFSSAARVVTVFSTSKDHGLGDDASCGCVLVDNQRLRFFNRARDFGDSHRQLPSRRHSDSRRLAIEATSPHPTAVLMGRCSDHSVTLSTCDQETTTSDQLQRFPDINDRSLDRGRSVGEDDGGTDDEDQQEAAGSTPSAPISLHLDRAFSTGSMDRSLPAGFDASDQQDNNQADDL